MAQPLSIPFHKQQAAGYCLPACVQMVLAYQQIDRSQTDLATELKVRASLGTPTRSVLGLASEQLRVVYGEGIEATLQKWLALSLPVIVFVQAGELSYWQGELFQHAVVVVGLVGNTVWLLDPDMDEIAIAVDLDEFMLAWLGMDYLYAVIYHETDNNS
jgi:ABC-type bacteriocin/lantibiotic exporter with double-glycine peptidase domain